ncbi:hypothetical protein BH09ACT5_BH09ACT5_22190 [soil metagenome]
MAEEFVVQSEEERPPRSWDFFLTVFLIFLLLVLTAIFVFLGFGLSVSTLGCADSSADCNGLVISIGTLLAIAGTSVVAIASIVVAVVFIARRRVAFVVPLVGCLVVVGLFLAGSWLVRLAVP